MLLREGQPVKLLLPIEFTVLGTITVLSEVKFWNALSLIEVICLPLYTEGMITVESSPIYPLTE